MANPMLNSGPMLARGLAQSRASEPTYAALRTALAAGTYQAGQAVFVESIDGSNRGRAGWDQIVAIGSLTDDDGVTLTGGGLAWKREFDGPINIRWFGAVGDGTTDDTAGIQAAVNYASSNGGGAVFIPPAAFAFASAITLASNVTLVGANPTASVLQYIGTGTNGLQSTSPITGLVLENFTLLGTAVANASENGIYLSHGSGFPKTAMRNLLVKNWGAVGIYVENGWDVLYEAVNVSYNKSHGLHLINCFSANLHKCVAFQNDGHGMFLQSVSGSSVSGTIQENKKNGLRIESAKGCFFSMYAEQNGWSTATDAEKAQVYVDQRAGGYSQSFGNEISVFGIGGAGSVSPTYESKYGIYVNYGRHNLIRGSLGGHLANNLYFTSNSANNIIGAFEHETGLTTDTPTPVVNNGVLNGYTVASEVKDQRIDTLSYASQSTVRSVTFAKAFSAAPRVVGTVVGTTSTTDATVKINNITATGFDFVVTDGSAYVNGATCNFIAIGA